MKLEAWQFIVALFALIGPGLFAIGMIWERVRSAHKRIDGLEELLQRELSGLRVDLKASIEQAWVNCPLAHQRREHSGG